MSIDDSIYDAARKSREDRWLGVLEFLVERLATTTGGHVQIGTYWACGDPQLPSSSITARVRSRSALPDIESDYWDGCLCYSRRETDGFADVFVFPFRQSLRVTSGGPRNSSDASGEYRWFQFVEDQFLDRGWSCSDGPGEWEWVSSPGDEYWQRLEATLESATVGAGQPIRVVIRGLELPTGHQQRLDSPVRFSLIHVNRDRELTNVHSWGERLPRKDSPHVIPLSRLDCRNADPVLDLSAFNVRGGWTPGRYHVAIRVQNHDPDWDFRADVSPPFRIVIR